MAFNTPFQMGQLFQMPGLNMQPNGSYEPQGFQTQYVDNATALGNQHGWDDPRTQGMQTRDAVRFQGGLNLENMNTGFNGLGSQLAGGVNGLGNQISDGFGNMADMAQYGGVYGQNQNSRNYSPQSGNWGGGGGMGGYDPFKISSF